MAKDRKRAEQRRVRKRHEREVARRRKRAGGPAIAVDLEERHPMPPYLEQLLVEQHVGPDQWERRFPELVRTDAVAALPDDLLVNAITVTTGRTPAEIEAGLMAAPTGMSAWGLGVDVWARCRLEPRDEQYLGVLAVELWKRRRPEQPCREQMLEGLVAGANALRVRPDPERLHHFAEAMRIVGDMVEEDERGLHHGGEPAEYLVRWVEPLAHAAGLIGGEEGERAFAVALRWCERLPRGSKDHARVSAILVDHAERLGRHDVAERLRGDVVRDLRAIIRPC
jgi:hypothetical protein